MKFLASLVRNVLWGIWFLSLPLTIIFLFPVLMSTSAPLGGGPAGYVLVLVWTVWAFAVPYLLYRWRRQSD